MKILLIGGGGREHAIAWKLKQSPKKTELFTSPGNAGTASLGTNLSLDSNQEIVDFCKDQNIELLIIGPEAPLVDGLVDMVKETTELDSMAVFGPKSYGAQLEGSKDFAKEFMIRNNIPTARSKTISIANLQEGMEFLETLSSPFVLKADGLAAGKGVLILEDLESAKSSLDEMIGGKFGSASDKVVIEEFLDGIELSVFIMTDGKNYLILPEAKDYKRIGEGDTGLNTGGMGAISPVAFADEEFLKKVESRIIIPTVEGLGKESIDYCGFIFFGLMNVKGEPFVIEYNCRLGDPEAEVVLPRIKDDLIEIILDCTNGTLSSRSIEAHEQAASTVMLVSGGYPEAYQKGKKISGLESLQEVIPFHAGTQLDNSGQVISSGGRVISITALGESINEALTKSKQGAELVDFEKKYFRRDIGNDLLSFEYS